jgi:hypothetical protein
MKNGIEDLRNHLFLSLERLGDTNVPVDIQRENAIANTARALIESAKVEVMAVAEVGKQLDSDLWKSRRAQPLQLVGNGSKVGS